MANHFCTKCGAALKEGAHFCGGCGAAVAAAASSPAPAAKPDHLPGTPPRPDPLPGTPAFVPSSGAAGTTPVHGGPARATGPGGGLESGLANVAQNLLSGVTGGGGGGGSFLGGLLGA